jgi:hypothetical protein
LVGCGGCNSLQCPHTNTRCSTGLAGIKVHFWSTDDDPLSKNVFLSHMFLSHVILNLCVWSRDRMGLAGVVMHRRGGGGGLGLDAADSQEPQHHRQEKQEHPQQQQQQQERFSHRSAEDITWGEIFDQLLVCLAELRVWVTSKIKRYPSPSPRPLSPNHPPLNLFPSAS